MKKTILKRILALVIVFMMLISTPFYISENINNSPYVYAAATFTQTLESELFKQTLIPTLISAGLVFTSKESIEKAAEDTIEWLKQQGFDWKPPNEPDGPNLEEVIKEMLKAITLVSASYELGKGIVEIPQMLWNLIKSFVDDNYDVGDNGDVIIEQEYESGFIKSDLSKYVSVIKNGNQYLVIRWTGVGADDTRQGTLTVTFPNGDVGSKSYSQIPYPWRHTTKYSIYWNAYGSGIINITDGGGLSVTWNIPAEYMPIVPDINYPIIGSENIVDNPNYDWNNIQTGTKTIPIPIQTDIYGNFITDENGYYLPSIDTEDWIDVQPTEIPNIDPSGTPIPDIPPFPDIENPEDDEKTGILIYIGNILQTIVGQLSKIVEGVKTIVSNTNRIVFNTPNPVFDPITGEQIDPETGEAIIPGSAGDGIIGNGIDTNIPTDFEWGSFRHFLDIFFIFIYFIVILILIILKFLQIVFVGIPNIAANTDLFAQYPNILEGVDYVKNLQVGGLTITVHQAFEFVFLIFFYIFIIKQIRKLYNAYVFEESAENKRISQDMKMDYYENNKHDDIMKM